MYQGKKEACCVLLSAKRYCAAQALPQKDQTSPARHSSNRDPTTSWRGARGSAHKFPRGKGRKSPRGKGSAASLRQGRSPERLSGKAAHQPSGKHLTRDSDRGAGRGHERGPQRQHNGDDRPSPRRHSSPAERVMKHARLSRTPSGSGSASGQASCCPPCQVYHKYLRYTLRLTASCVCQPETLHGSLHR